MKMKKLLLCLLFGSVSLSTLAQKETTNPSSNYLNKKVIHKLGLHAGTTSGAGLSYKALINNKLMIQMVSLPIASQDYKIINTGLSLKYKFRDYNMWDFYSYVSGSHYFNQDRFYAYDAMDPWLDTTYEYEYKNNFHSSAGFAFEYGKGELIKLSTQVGYGAYFIGKSKWMTNLSIGVTVDFALNSK